MFGAARPNDLDAEAPLKFTLPIRNRQELARLPTAQHGATTSGAKLSSPLPIEPKRLDFGKNGPDQLAIRPS